jgi:hypothetical protein
MKQEQLRGKLAHELNFATEQFAAHFAGREVGWEEMLEKQAEALAQPQTKIGPLLGRICGLLGNSCHTDRDGARSFAVRLRAKPDGCECGWWLLFPEHGVAVALAHGTWISWDGRSQPHCSSVPSAVCALGAVCARGRWAPLPVRLPACQPMLCVRA